MPSSIDFNLYLLYNTDKKSEVAFMKRKTLFLLPCLLLLFFCFPLITKASVEKYKIGDNVWCYLEPKKENELYRTLVIEGTGSTYDYERDGYDVTGKIKKPAMLDGRYNLYVSDGITTLGSHLLYKTTIMQINHLSKDLKRINYRCMTACLCYINYDELPKELEYFHISGFVNILFPDEVTVLPFQTVEQGFYTGENITHIFITDKTKSISGKAFNELPNLKVCEIPPSVTYIGNNVFWRNTDNLIIRGYTNSYAEKYAKSNGIRFESTGEAQVLPTVGKTYSVGNLKYLVKSKSSVSVIGLTDKDKKTKTITIPNEVVISSHKLKVECINAKAFYKNGYATKVTIGSNIKSIGANTFYKCNKLKTLKINTSKLTSVGKNAFYSNKNLKIYVPSKKYTSYKKLIDKSGIYKTAKYVKF